MRVRTHEYDITWYDPKLLEQLQDIETEVLADMWALRFGKELVLDDVVGRVEDSGFVRAATTRLLRDGYLLKRINFAGNSVSFLLKEY